MDNKFTELIKHWLETPSDQRDYSVGALYLLKLSGNQIMYRNIVAQLDRRHELHNPGGEVVLKQAQHCRRLHLVSSNGTVKNSNTSRTATSVSTTASKPSPGTSSANATISKARWAQTTTCSASYNPTSHPLTLNGSFQKE